VNWSDASTDNPRTDLNVTANIAVTANFAIDQMTIFGYITEPDANIPVEGVFINANNGGGSDTTDANGYYQLTVDYGWDGTVTPTMAGYTFDPASKVYTDVTENQIQNYAATLNTYTISGYIENECNEPIEGVLVDANNGGGEDTTDVNGFYEVGVDYNWSGTVTPSKVYYTFDPINIAYNNVLEDKTGQDYEATNIYDLDCDGYIGWGDVAVMSEDWLEPGGPDVPSDIHKDDNNIVNFLDFADFALVWQAGE
jgi:hypothetical protein